MGLRTSATGPSGDFSLHPARQARTLPSVSAPNRFVPALLILSGWGLAAWLGWKCHLAGRLEPIALSPPAPGGTREEASEIAGIFRAWSADPSLAGASIGFCLLDEEGRTVFASPLAETALCPASALKTLTTGAAFGLLGPEYRFETALYSNAEIDANGVLDGDLILEGSGDPTLSIEDLGRLAGAAGASGGLKRVRGTLRVDVAGFPVPPANEHWNWGDIGNAYGAGAFGVNLNRNRMLIRFAPGARPAEPARVLGAEPMTSGLEWINHVATGPPGSGDRVTVYSEPYGRRVTLRGTVPAGEAEFAVNAAIPDPPRLAGEILRGKLEEEGIVFEGRVYPPAPRAAEKGGFLRAHRSTPLPEIVDHLHRVSDNLEAQCLFLTMGHLKREDPARVVREYWEKAGVSFTGLRLIDGSGLARANMIRPLDLARVNHAARRGPHGDRFRESLSAYLDGKVRSKLGAMSGVKTDAGFLTLPDGRECTYALMANGLDTRLDFWPLRARLLESVRTARF